MKTKMINEANTVNAKPNYDLAGPVANQLPAGFAEWVMMEAKTTDGVSRTAMARKAGQFCAWRPWFTLLCEKQGYVAWATPRRGHGRARFFACLSGEVPHIATAPDTNQPANFFETLEVPTEVEITKAA